MSSLPSTRPLTGQVALVAGATRGAGRGIARMLGEAGATVYCTGRGTRTSPSVGARAGRPETIEDTAALVDDAGGIGIAVAVDHADPAAVKRLVARIKKEHGRLDVLANVLGGPEATHRMQPLWKLPLDEGRALLDAWVWPHVVTCHAALPLMIARQSGLVVEVIEGETLAYNGHLFFDLAVTSLKRLAYVLAEELAPHGVTALAVAPGFMRTEQILDHFGATEQTWRAIAESSAQARGFGFAGSETPCFVGRAVAALAADPHVAQRAGGVYGSWELAESYGFVDVDGASPRWGTYFAQHFPQFAAAVPNSGRRWQVAPR